MKGKVLEKYYNNNNEGTTEIQIGVDEAGRGSLIGPVFAGVVVWNNDLEHENLKYIKDSKTLTKDKRNEMRRFIEKHSLAWAVAKCDHTVIDDINILNATYKAMHKALKEVYDNNIKFNRILVDGNRFKPFLTKDGFIEHNCIIKGDNKYIQIAAASILAKTHHDEYIENMCKENPELSKYGLLTNQGYGTKEHRLAIKQYGTCVYHRKSFKVNIDKI